MSETANNNLNASPGPAAADDRAVLEQAAQQEDQLREMKSKIDELAGKIETMDQKLDAVFGTVANIEAIIIEIQQNGVAAVAS